MAVGLPKFAVITTALLLLLLCRLSYISMNLDDCDYTYDYRQLQESGVDRKCNNKICKKYCKAYGYAPQASECDVDDEYVCCCKYCNLKLPKPGNCEQDACKGECSTLDYTLENSYCRGLDECCCLDIDEVPELDSDSSSSSSSSDDSLEDPDSDDSLEVP